MLSVVERIYRNALASERNNRRRRRPPRSLTEEERLILKIHATPGWPGPYPEPVSSFWSLQYASVPQHYPPTAKKKGMK